MAKTQIVLLAHNIRSCLNVGSLLRTADGLGVKQVYLTGYTPYPAAKNDQRLPHLRDKLHRQIQKSSLGAETSVRWVNQKDPGPVLKRLAKDGYQLVALEQTEKAKPLPKFQPGPKVALLVGSEKEGINDDLLKLCTLHIQIPMSGKKESFNVAVAAAMALYQLRWP